jgi:hypothetical protein
LQTAGASHQDDPMAGSLPWRLVVIVCLDALAAPREAAAQLSQASSGFALADLTEGPSSVTETPGPDRLDVTLGATAEEIEDLDDDQYLDDFKWEAMMLGTGSVTWGSFSGALSLQTSATPQAARPAPGGPLQPLVNAGNAQAGGTVHLRFSELGLITSQTLAVGSPVTVELNCRVDTLGFVSGSINPPNETRVGGSGECRVINNSGGGSLTEVLVGPNEIETKSLAAAVGDQLAIEGVFRVVGEAYAGAAFCCMEYTGDADAGIDASGGLWLGMPAGTGLTAPSGHDYTVPVPEPDVPPSAAAAGLVLLGLRWLVVSYANRW